MGGSCAIIKNFGTRRKSKCLKKKKENHVPIPKYPYLGIGPWQN
jgi:hypothetical protein